MDRESRFNGDLDSEEGQGSINAKEILLKYLHYSWLFAVAVGLALTLAWLYMRYTKPVYSVSSTLLIRNDNQNRGSGNSGMNSQDMFSDIALFQSNTNKQNEILILSSRTMMERVVKSLGLQEAFAAVGNVKTTDIYPEQPFELEIISLADSSSSFSFEIHFSPDWKTFRLGDNKKDWVAGQEIQTSLGEFKFRLRESADSRLSFRDFTVAWMPLRNAATAYMGGLT